MYLNTFSLKKSNFFVDVNGPISRLINKNARNLISDWKIGSISLNKILKLIKNKNQKKIQLKFSKNLFDINLITLINIITT